MRINVALDIKSLQDWELELLIKEANTEVLRRNPPKRDLPPLSTDEMRMVQFDMTIPAIKSYRQRNETLQPGLRECKDLCDAHRELCKREGTFVARD